MSSLPSYPSDNFLSSSLPSTSDIQQKVIMTLENYKEAIQTILARDKDQSLCEEDGYLSFEKVKEEILVKCPDMKENQFFNDVIPALYINAKKELVEEKKGGSEVDTRV